MNLRNEVLASGVTKFVTSYEELEVGKAYLKYYISNKDNVLRSFFFMCCLDMQGKKVLIPFTITNWAERDIARRYCIDFGLVFAYIPKELDNNG